MKIFYIVYLIGFILAFIITRRNDNDADRQTWFAVFAASICALFSWIIVIGYIIEHAKPPKWL